MERETQKQYEEYVLSQGALRIAHMKLAESRNRLISAQTQLKESETLIADGEEVVRKNSADIQACMRLAKEIAINTDDSFKRMVLRVFKTVFNNMRSRTTDLVKIKTDYSSGMLTFGKTGFGIKHNVQSQPLERFEQIAAIFANKDAIIQVMAEYQGTKKWIDKLNLMAELLPDPSSLKRGDVKIPLQEKILVPHDRIEQSYNRFDIPLRVDSASFEYDCIRLWGEESDDEDSYRADYRLNIREAQEAMEWKDATCYVQLEPSIKKLVEAYKKEASPVLEQIKQVKTQLKAAFGAELLFAEL